MFSKKKYRQEIDLETGDDWKENFIFLKYFQGWQNKQWLHCRKWQLLIAYMAHKWLG